MTSSKSLAGSRFAMDIANKLVPLICRSAWSHSNVNRPYLITYKKKVGIMFFFNKCIGSWIRRSASFMGSTDRLWIIKLAAKTFRILQFVTEIYVYENRWIADFLNACNAHKKRPVHESKEACSWPSCGVLGGSNLWANIRQSCCHIVTFRKWPPLKQSNNLMAYWVGTFSHF